MQHLIDLYHPCLPARHAIEAHQEIGPSCQLQKITQQSGIKTTKVTLWSTNLRPGASSTSTTEPFQRVTTTCHKNRSISRDDCKTQKQTWSTFTTDPKSNPTSPEQTRKETSTSPTKDRAFLSEQVSLSTMMKAIRETIIQGLRGVWTYMPKMMPHSSNQSIQDQDLEL